MLRRMLKSKVHRATITAADLHYEGSLNLDTELAAFRPAVVLVDEANRVRPLTSSADS